jgi:hypothetical protein
MEEDRAGATPTVAGTGLPDLNVPQAAVTPWKLDAVFELPEIPEPSGLCYCELTNTIFVVDDGGPDRPSGLYEIDLDGKYLRGTQFGTDLEGVTYCSANGLLYVCDEADERVHIVEPKALALQSSFQVSRLYDYPREDGKHEATEVLRAGGNGFEGIAWFDIDKMSEGYPQTMDTGYLVLLNQDDPACLIVVDPLRATADKPARMKSFVMLPQRNSGELYINEEQHQVWVVNSWLNTLAIIDSYDPGTGAWFEAKIARWEVLPGMAQEGLTFDPQGRMWIGQDVGGVVRYVKGD